MVRKIYLVVYSYHDIYDVCSAYFNKRKAEAFAKSMNEQYPKYPYYMVEELIIEDA